MKDRNKVRDLTGQKFGRLTVLHLQDTDTRKTYWICKCDCGNLKSVRSDSLLDGSIKSCGCLKVEQDKKNLVNPSMIKSYAFGEKYGTKRIYHIWQGMKARCGNVHSPCYERYGGRGIQVCEEWENDFLKFYEWAMKNGYDDSLTIDRIDNNGNYEPQNCRWVDSRAQAMNRRSNVNITIGNSTRTLMEWCEIFKLNYGTVKARFKRDEDISIDKLFNKS